MDNKLILPRSIEVISGLLAAFDNEPVNLIPIDVGGVKLITDEHSDFVHRWPCVESQELDSNLIAAYSSFKTMRLDPTTTECGPTHHPMSISGDTGGVAHRSPVDDTRHELLRSANARTWDYGTGWHSRPSETARCPLDGARQEH